MSGLARRLHALRRDFLPAAALLVQLYALIGLIHGSASTSYFLALHLAGAAIAATGLFPRNASPRDRAAYLLAYGSVGALFPVAGVAAAYALNRIVYVEYDESERSDHVIWDHSVTHFIPGYSVDADIDALKDRFSVDLKDDRNESRNDLLLAETLPYRLRDRNPEVRRNAIRPLARLRTDHAASILREVMFDDDEQVRLLAQNAMQSIRDRHDEILTGLAEAVAANPSDALTHLRLADSYSAQADMNLEQDSEAVAANRAKAAAEIDAAVALSDPAKNPEMALRLIRRSFILGRVDLAKKFVGDALAQGVSDVRLKEALIEVAYAERDWPTMFRLLRELPPAPTTSPLFRYVRNHWLRGRDVPVKGLP